MSTDVGFEELRFERQALNDAVARHHASVSLFQHPARPWFRQHTEEPPTDDPVRHFTSSATCIESLHDVPDDYRAANGASSRHDARAQLAADFAKVALDASAGRWQSDRAAHVYCRVRTLAPILRYAPVDDIAARGDAIRSHIRYVWTRLKPKDRKFQGITEKPQQPQARSKGPATYPPNAFHTFWAVRLLEEYQRHEARLGRLPADLATKKAVAELWTRQTMAAQAALITSRAEQVDAHQLAWAMSLEFRQTALEPTTASSTRLELYRTALAAFFAEQRPSGNWPLYTPLFHYPAAGNAYCYTFETLTELLRPALDEQHGKVLRQLLRPHLPKLLAAWHFADRTAISTGDRTVGWCSGHHPHRTHAEAWATAEVFSFLQVLRRLVGRWTSEEAAEALRARPPKFASSDAAAKTLGSRGETWTQPTEWTLGRRLAALFLHPMRALLTEQATIDPDRPLVVDDGQRLQARSAILFGPPGASKTTLVEALAGAIGWRFVEIHAADFLSEGMDKVPAKADEIFAQLMELDRCVVLFDEIDELIRERQSTESDPFGRFLTTSMLPKLAKLWDQRRILYFVATNDIESADPAIKRSQRFDAALFAAPPSFAVKREYLERELGLVPKSITYESVSTALNAKWELAYAVGVFALLRYDQIAGLAENLRPLVTNGDVPEAEVRRTLFEMGEDLMSLEWRDRRVTTEHGEPPRNPYEMYRHFRKAERRDARMYQLATIVPPPTTVPDGLRSFDGTAGSYYQLVAPLETLAVTGKRGRWQMNAEGGMVMDHGLLDFQLKDGRSSHDPSEERGSESVSTGGDGATAESGLTDEEPGNPQQ